MREIGERRSGAVVGNPKHPGSFKEPGCWRTMSLAQIVSREAAPAGSPDRQVGVKRQNQSTEPKARHPVSHTSHSSRSA
jgi:hypothetical protein